MIYSAHQANLLPYPGFFAKMELSDVFGLMPFVQFEKGGYQNRVQLLNGSKPFWFTVPVHLKSDMLISEVTIADVKTGKLVKTLQEKSRYCKLNSMTDQLCDVFVRLCVSGKFLFELCESVIDVMMSCMGIESRVRIQRNDDGPSKSLAIATVESGCDGYLSGPGGRGYLAAEEFDGLGLSCLKYGPYGSTDDVLGSVSAVELVARYGSDWREAVGFGREAF